MTTHKTIEHTPHLHGKVAAGEPGFALGLAGFITSFVSGVVGLVLSAVALGQSKRVGKENTFALVGLIIGIVHTALSVLGLIAGIIATIAIVNYCEANQDKCQDNSNYGGYNQPMTDNSGGQKTY